MSIIPKKNTHDLTEEEIAVLRGPSVSPVVKAGLARQHDNIGTKVSAYRKVAAAWRAEADAIAAALELSRLHGEMADLAEAKEKIKRMERQNSSLEATVSRKDGEIMRLTAGPAMAVHSGRD